MTTTSSSLTVNQQKIFDRLQAYANNLGGAGKFGVEKLMIYLDSLIRTVSPESSLEDRAKVVAHFLESKEQGGLSAVLKSIGVAEGEQANYFTNIKTILEVANACADVSMPIRNDLKSYGKDEPDVIELIQNSLKDISFSEGSNRTPYEERKIFMGFVQQVMNDVVTEDGKPEDISRERTQKLAALIDENKNVFSAGFINKMKEDLELHIKECELYEKDFPRHLAVAIGYEQLTEASNDKGVLGILRDLYQSWGKPAHKITLGKVEGKNNQELMTMIDKLSVDDKREVIDLVKQYHSDLKKEYEKQYETIYKSFEEQYKKEHKGQNPTADEIEAARPKMQSTAVKAAQEKCLKDPVGGYELKFNKLSPEKQAYLKLLAQGHMADATKESLLGKLPQNIKNNFMGSCIFGLLLNMLLGVPWLISVPVLTLINGVGDTKKLPPAKAANDYGQAAAA